MNGAEILLTTAVKADVVFCFPNPGTTELPLVAAFDTVPGIRPVLGLFEGCCAGAAGGSIGMGLPLSIGAALACPDRPVIDFQADGSEYRHGRQEETQGRRPDSGGCSGPMRRQIPIPV